MAGQLITDDNLLNLKHVIGETMKIRSAVSAASASSAGRARQYRAAPSIALSTCTSRRLEQFSTIRSRMIENCSSWHCPCRALTSMEQAKDITPMPECAENSAIGDIADAAYRLVSRASSAVRRGIKRRARQALPARVMEM